MRLVSRLHHKGILHRNRKFLPIFLSSLFIAFHYGLVLYIESSFLETFFTQIETAFLFGLGAVLFLILILSGEVIKKIGARKIFALFTTVEALATCILAFSNSPILIALGFILAQGSVGFLSYLMDIFLEREMKDETTTGEVRGIFLTAANLALIFAPLLSGFLLVNNDYRRIFLFSLLALIPVFFLQFGKQIEKHSIPQNHGIIPHSLRLGIFLSFILQFFYGWMVAWSPIYLHQIIGFDWPTIGVIFSIMLLPFVLFELPLGELEDRMFGEKEIMAGGFLLAGIATASVSLISGASFMVWALVLFLTRTGASAIEISTESYFFKHVSGGDTGIIGIFRLVKPVALISAPIIGALCIKLLGFGPSFIVLGGILVMSAFVAMRLKDTR
ncbi:MAG: MFS transporter [Minisyncoccia bacterium]